ncbi:hypothetical protein TRM7557_02793 [Tritonibacter multivorans]|uniref:GAF domain-containing protein n=1 Tax=Tritonibacter multivorans TaxID=928856 RepID=A0A0N7M0E5_9RHOB|nr:GAF domain-containing protein [Tritonibacter multivorans]MDA7421069.1 GAF domain-containing protein [Tritonibacter multivorans]CUH80241.1 hypothetical protein TRM7557_02793 [Tritonibacter multivorans]SFC76412.1 GAF domain-containing protein [Tritonibacter multivorans]
MSQEATQVGESKLTEIEIRLDEISGQDTLSIDDKIQAILQEGNAHFGTAFALVSEIKGDVYRVVFSESDIAPAEPGTEFPLGETYCLQTMRAGGPVAYHAAGASDLSDHPCYSVFQLETYIGAPMMQGTQVLGTVNFTNIEARAPFSAQDLATISGIASRVQALLKAA